MTDTKARTILTIDNRHIYNFKKRYDRATDVLINLDTLSDSNIDMLYVRMYRRVLNIGI